MNLCWVINDKLVERIICFEDFGIMAIMAVVPPSVANRTAVLDALFNPDQMANITSPASGDASAIATLVWYSAIELTPSKRPQGQRLP